LPQPSGDRSPLRLARLASRPPLPRQPADLVALLARRRLSRTPARARPLLDPLRLDDGLVEVQHRDRGHVGDVLAATLEQRGIRDLDVEQHGIETLAAEAPQGGA